jgi:integrase
MAKLEYSLSARTQDGTGRNEVMLRFFQGSKFNLRAKSDVYVNPDFFEYYVNRSRTYEKGIRIPDRVISATVKVAEQKHWYLRGSGLIVVDGRRLETEDVKHHRDMMKRLEDMKHYIFEQYESADKDSITGTWLRDAVEKFNHPNKLQRCGKSFYELVEEYIEKKNMSKESESIFRVFIRSISRYESYIRATDKHRKKFVFDINLVTKDDIEGYADYLRNEKSLSEQMPTLFKKLLTEYPACLKKGRNYVEERGENTIIKMMGRLKALFSYFFEKGLTKNRPFEYIKIGTPKVGTPYYITIEERNQIMNANLDLAWKELSDEERKAVGMPIETINNQRDIFVFQCFVGCRVGDLVKLTENHISSNILSYTPHKTKDSTGVPVRVPLLLEAINLINQYRGKDRQGRLFPFITPQKYNKAIKVIFKMAGVTRSVEVRNSLTGETELHPINEIAASHLARRTFVGNIYLSVQDPSLIGKMSGHAEGSRAFRRYRNIEDSTLREAVRHLNG